MPFSYWYRDNPADDIDTLQDQGVISPLLFGLFVPALFVWYGVACIVSRKAIWVGTSFHWSSEFMGTDAVIAGIASLAVALILSARFGWHRVPILRIFWQLGFLAGIIIWLAAVIAIIVRQAW